MKRKTVTAAKVSGILSAYSSKCYLCSKELGLRGSFHLDHIIPFAMGGKDDESNLAPICLPCHAAKTNAPIVGDKAKIAKAKRLELASLGYRKTNKRQIFNSKTHTYTPKSRQLDDENGGYSESIGGLK